MNLCAFYPPQAVFIVHHDPPFRAPHPSILWNSSRGSPVHAPILAQKPGSPSLPVLRLPVISCPADQQQTTPVSQEPPSADPWHMARLRMDKVIELCPICSPSGFAQPPPDAYCKVSTLGSNVSKEWITLKTVTSAWGWGRWIGSFTPQRKWPIKKKRKQHTKPEMEHVDSLKYTKRSNLWIVDIGKGE